MGHGFGLGLQMIFTVEEGLSSSPLCITTLWHASVATSFEVLHKHQEKSVLNTDLGISFAQDDFRIMHNNHNSAHVSEKPFNVHTDFELRLFCHSSVIQTHILLILDRMSQRLTYLLVPSHAAGPQGCLHFFVSGLSQWQVSGELWLSFQELEGWR